MAGLLKTKVRVCYRGELVLLNRGTGGHWLTLKLVGTRANRDGAGAKVRVGKQWAYATTSGGYLSANDGRVHFGLGAEQRVTVEVVWPGGKRQALENVAADQIVIVKENK